MVSIWHHHTSQSSLCNE